MRNINKVQNVGIILACILLMSCGDSGGSVASTPAPTPTPTPAPTYTTYANLTGNQTFQTAAARAQSTVIGNFTVGGTPRGGAANSFPVNVVTSNTTVFMPTALDNTVGIAYDANAKTYTVTAPNTTLTFAPSDSIQLTDNSGSPVTKASGYLTRDALGAPTALFVIVTPSIAGVDLSYTRFAYGAKFSGQTGIGAVTDSIGGVFGVPTVATDMPKTGTATYSKTVVAGTAFAAVPVSPGNVQYGLENSTATFSADFGAGTVQTKINLVPTVALTTQANINGTVTIVDFNLPAITLGTLTGTGNIATATQHFSGTLTAAGGPFTNGNFGGAFFGPQAAEFGYSFAIVGPGGAGATGSVVGAK